MKRTTTFRFVVAGLFCATVVLVAGTATAQDRATITLRSGDKISGQLVDLGGLGYTVMVNGAERNILPEHVAAIDFTGTMTDADWAAFKGSPQIVLRDGETIDGWLYDIAGTTPLHLTIRTRDGDRQLGSNEVARIVMSRPEKALGMSGRASTLPIIIK
jgi:hypothetical protein